MTLTKGRWEHKKSHQNQIPLPLRHNDLVNLMRNIRPTFSSRINSNILKYMYICICIFTWTTLTIMNIGLKMAATMLFLININ